MLVDTLLLIDTTNFPPIVLTLFCSLLFSLSVLLWLYHIPGLLCLLSVKSVDFSLSVLHVSLLSVPLLLPRVGSSNGLFASLGLPYTSSVAVLGIVLNVCHSRSSVLTPFLVAS